jgi:hypothetical protein
MPTNYPTKANLTRSFGAKVGLTGWPLDLEISGDIFKTLPINTLSNKRP